MMGGSTASCPPVHNVASKSQIISIRDFLSLMKTVVLLKFFLCQKTGHSTDSCFISTV